LTGVITCSPLAGVIICSPLAGVITCQQLIANCISVGEDNNR